MDGADGSCLHRRLACFSFNVHAALKQQFPNSGIRKGSIKIPGVPIFTSYWGKRLPSRLPSRLRCVPTLLLCFLTSRT